MGQLMQKSKVASAIFDMVEPALRFVAHDLQVLTANRPGNKDFHPSVLDLYETTLVFQVYRHMLMYSELRDYDVRWEMPMGAKYVDLWMRPLGGGEPNLVEAGDFTVPKVHDDLEKLRTLASKSHWYFLAFFRTNKDDTKGEPSEGQLDPAKYIKDSMAMPKYGLDPSKVEYNPEYCRSIRIVGPGERTDVVGYALLKGL
ncbi:MAG: hypothetical protein HRU70_10205 [Phycisphaeraceae bacterium]|nr:MAG: hypothetical protein HRU70_10205 [Phycisphaeraceae bacterium]